MRAHDALINIQFTDGDGVELLSASKLVKAEEFPENGRYALIGIPFSEFNKTRADPELPLDVTLSGFRDTGTVIPPSLVRVPIVEAIRVPPIVAFNLSVGTAVCHEVWSGGCDPMEITVRLRNDGNYAAYLCGACLSPDKGSLSWSDAGSSKIPPGDSVEWNATLESRFERPTMVFYETDGSAAAASIPEEASGVPNP
jgi:hypothetical protein